MEKSMVTYVKDEMVGITELGKSLGNYLDKVTSNALSKIAIVRRNKPEAVIVPIQEYEYMRESADILEELEIAQIIKERVLDKKEPVEMISSDQMKEFLKNRNCNV